MDESPVMKCAYVSQLSTDSYLPGVLTLHQSLRSTGTRQPFLLLITRSVSAQARDRLARHGIDWRMVDDDVASAASAASQLADAKRNLLQVQPGPMNGTLHPARWSHTWAKLHVFELVEFDRVVYLDVDMLINRNIDELFGRPHMSAVNAGGMLPEHDAWVQLNSGLMVIEPSTHLYADMMRHIAAADLNTEHDQAFLQAYYSDWPARPELHLDHTFNMFDICIDRYHELFGYRLEDIHVIHFIGTKPWDEAGALARWNRRATARMRRLLKGEVAVTTGPLREAAYRLWARCYGGVTKAAATNGRA